MPATIDAISQPAGHTGYVYTWDHTVGDHDDRILLVAIAGRDSASLSSVTFNGVEMSRMAVSEEAGDNARLAAIYYLIAPASGAGEIVVTGTYENPCSAISLYGVNQATPFRTAGETHGPGGAESQPYSLSLAAFADDLIIASGCGWVDGADYKLVPGDGQIIEADYGASARLLCTSKAPATGTSVIDGTVNGSVVNAYAVCAVCVQSSPLASPSISPEGGTYNTEQTVTITAAAGSIYYTRDGSDPSTATSGRGATRHSSVVVLTVSATETIKAMAVRTGYANSPVATAAFVMLPPDIAADPYLSLVMPQHRDKARYMAWLNAAMGVFADIYNVLSYMIPAFSIDAANIEETKTVLGTGLGDIILTDTGVALAATTMAIGSQLDIIGQIVGRSRAVDFQPSGGVSPILDDETYRTLLKARIGANHWDGRHESLYDLWKALFPGGSISVTDNQDMTMAVSMTGAFSSIIIDLITHDLVVPRPEGVLMSYNYAPMPYFGFDAASGYINGFDAGNWAK